MRRLGAAGSVGLWLLTPVRVSGVAVGLIAGCRGSGCWLGWWSFLVVGASPARGRAGEESGPAAVVGLLVLM